MTVSSALSEIDLLILHAAPESFYEYIVSPTPFSIHPDSDVVLLELSCQSITGQLAARICIEDLRSATRAMASFSASRQKLLSMDSPAEDFSAVPVEDSG